MQNFGELICNYPCVNTVNYTNPLQFCNHKCKAVFLDNKLPLLINFIAESILYSAGGYVHVQKKQ